MDVSNIQSADVVLCTSNSPSLVEVKDDSPVTCLCSEDVSCLLGIKKNMSVSCNIPLPKMRVGVVLCFV